MAVTHADLAPSRISSDLGSKNGLCLLLLSISLGLFCFVLSIIAEASRSQVQWVGGLCAYRSGGQMAFVSATVSFFFLAMGMAVQHTYLLVAVSKSDALFEISCDSDSDVAKAFTLSAGFFFVTSWVSFAVGEILLLIGLSVESGHLKNWKKPRPSCLATQRGLFTSAGIFGLLTVVFGGGLYITALRAERKYKRQANSRLQVLESSILHETPPRTITIAAATNENPVPTRHDQNDHTLYRYLRSFDKQTNLV